MDLMENEIIIAAAKKFTRKEQINIAIEELSELIQALCKLNRKGSEVEYRCRLMDIHEEIADVEIAIAQIKLSFEMALAVKSWKEVKLERLESLIEKNILTSIIQNAALSAQMQMEADGGYEKYSCPCGWEGYYIELIQAGPIHELCPECETLIK